MFLTNWFCAECTKLIYQSAGRCILCILHKIGDENAKFTGFFRTISSYFEFLSYGIFQVWLPLHKLLHSCFVVEIPTLTFTFLSAVYHRRYIITGISLRHIITIISQLFISSQLYLNYLYHHNYISTIFILSQARHIK